jgi:hypothetical protein
MKELVNEKDVEIKIIKLEKEEMMNGRYELFNENKRLKVMSNLITLNRQNSKN